ncbi:MAG: RNA 2',3'-cyclic phosphodiesterase [Spirochaetaceae bacterium]|jgi:2'-5' RNA ligase|nr:RNA 2',3'-cyclic phosphodiesterase [Spirochaetaceae bacterium]
MRVFVALTLPDEFKAALAAKTETLRRKHPDFRWTPDRNLHITLAFLGEVERTGLHFLTGIVEDIASGTNRISLSGSRLFTLPQKKPANVLVLGFDRGREKIAYLAERIEAGLELLAADGRYSFRPREKRPFTSHLTIARKGRKPVMLSPLELIPVQIEAMAETVTVFESELLREGAEYKALAEFRLL